MTEQLKPCPHCGGKARIVNTWSRRNIYCTTRFCTLGINNLSEDDAVKCWNRRATPAPVVEVTDEMVELACRGARSSKGCPMRPWSRLTEADKNVERKIMRAALVAAIGGPLDKPNGCIWAENGDGDGAWEGTCGVRWFFADGNVEENLVKFCPSCGQPVRMAYELDHAVKP